MKALILVLGEFLKYYIKLVEPKSRMKSQSRRSVSSQKVLKSIQSDIASKFLNISYYYFYDICSCHSYWISLLLLLYTRPCEISDPVDKYKQNFV